MVAAIDLLAPQGNRLGLNILILPGLVHGLIKKGFHVALFYTTSANTNEFDHNVTSYISLPRPPVVFTRISRYVL